MADDRAASASAGPKRGRIPWWAWSIIGVSTTAAAVAVGLAVWFVGSIAGAFLPPDVNGAVWHVQGMSCATWAKATTEPGGFDLTPSAVIQVGLQPNCSAGEINATYSSLYKDTVSVRHNDSFRVEYLVQKKAPEKPVGRSQPTTSAVAQLIIEKNYDLPRPRAFARTVDDWLTVRALVDPGAQLALLEDASRADERYVANSTASRLRTLSSSLPKRLREQAWKITIPAKGNRPFVREGGVPAGGVTIETSHGFPDPWLVDFGKQLNGAWPSDGTPEYVYVFRDPPNSGGYFNELTARVFDVARPQGATDHLTPAPGTTAWPALLAAVDAMASTPGSKGSDFAIGFALYSRSFTAHDAYSRWASNSIRGDSSLAIVGPSQCSQPLETAPDDNAIGSALCGYLRQRATTADGGDGGN